MNWGFNHRDTKIQRNWRSEIPRIFIRMNIFGISILQFLFCAFVSLWSVPCFAQQRPLITEDPRLIPTGAFVVESGFGYARKAQFPLSGLKGDEYSAFQNGFNFSLGSLAEFQINGTMQNFVKTGDQWRNDWGDWSLSTKIRIVPETHVLPIISFRPTMVLPNSNDSKGIGTNSPKIFGTIL